MSRARTLALWVTVLAVALSRTVGAKESLGAHDVATNTARVSDALLSADTLWVSSEGGVERYDLPSRQRTGHWTRLEGLEETRVLSLAEEGGLVATTRGARCRLVEEAFVCTKTGSPPAATVAGRPSALGRLHHGARVVRSWRWHEQELVATATQGVWLGEQRLTPARQLCGNHVTGLARFRGTLYVGTFEDGVCRLTDSGFEPLADVPRQVNALLATTEALWVGTSQGLWRLTETSLEPVSALMDYAVVSLATEKTYVVVATSAALWWLDATNGAVVSERWRPGGSRALQRVKVAGGQLWLATEDRGAVVRRGREMHVLDRTRGAESSWLLDVDPDGAGGAWLATLRDGLEHLGPTGSLGVALRGTWGLTLLRGERHLYYGSQEGLFIHPLQGTLEQWDASDALVDGRVHALLEEPGTLWVGTELGLQRLPRPR